MEKNDCVFEDKRYPNGSELCMGNECIQCDDGQWQVSEFEVGYRY
jgi:hypothetical protein